MSKPRGQKIVAVVFKQLLNSRSPERFALGDLLTSGGFMITLRQILNAQSSVLKGKRVKLVRHKDHRTEYRDVIKDKNKLLVYQNTQPKHVFKDCDYIISFIGLERKRSVLFGVFKVNGTEILNGEYVYDMRNVNAFDDLTYRLVIDWGDNTRAWHQWYDRQEKEVIEILPQGYIGNFPGLLNFVLEFDELRTLINNPDANYEWRHHLSAVNGVYLILDNLTGQQYIGSANGKYGIWQRWSNYSATGHGGNKELMVLHDADPAYHRHFRLSVLQTLPSNITQREIVAIENLYKQKLGARAHGLNQN